MALIYPLAASAAMLALPENLKYDPSSGGFNLTAGEHSSEGGFGIPRFGGLQGLPFDARAHLHRESKVEEAEVRNLGP